MFSSEEPDAILLDDAVKLSRKATAMANKGNTGNVDNNYSDGVSRIPPATAVTPQNEEDIWFELQGNRTLVIAVGYNSGQMMVKFPEIRPHRPEYSTLGTAYEQIGDKIMGHLMEGRVGIADFIKRIDAITPMRQLSHQLSQKYK